MRQFLLLAIFWGVFTTVCFSQYAFDIKTSADEKEDLQNVKQGLIKAIAGSSWATEKETGEDYSIWLHNFRRFQSRDSIRIMVTVELRTPAMFSRGDFVANRRIWLQYHWQKAQEYAKQNFSRNYFKEAKEEDFSKMIGIVSGVQSGLSATELAGIDIDKLALGLRGIFNRNPSPVEVMESFYLGKKSLKVMEEMIRNL